jgi:hypothetical protein
VKQKSEPVTPARPLTLPYKYKSALQTATIIRTVEENTDSIAILSIYSILTEKERKLQIRPPIIEQSNKPKKLIVEK